MPDFSDRTRTGISILTSVADSVLSAFDVILVTFVNRKWSENLVRFMYVRSWHQTHMLKEEKVLRTKDSLPWERKRRNGLKQGSLQKYSKWLR